jgi:hypothetical protein
MEKTFEELIKLQKEKLLRVAKELVPSVIEDDLLQPNDFPVLENHPYFRYEEGVLEGILTARAAYLAEKVEGLKSF